MQAAAKQLARRLLPKSVRPHRILAGPLRGQYLVTSWHDYPAGVGGYTEPDLLAWFNHHVKPSQCWLDVGAHYGYTSIALSNQVGPHGAVWAFEPVTETAGHLARTAALNRLTQLRVIPMALGEPESLAMERFGSVRGMAEIGQTTLANSQSILISRLDWLWPRLGGDAVRIDGVKIDVQGMELQVLRGMSDILRTHQPIVVVELHAGVDRAAVLQLFATAGYHQPAMPIEASEAQGAPQFADDCSYAFFPHPRQP